LIALLTGAIKELKIKNDVLVTKNTNLVALLVAKKGVITQAEADLL